MRDVIAATIEECANVADAMKHAFSDALRLNLPSLQEAALEGAKSAAHDTAARIRALDPAAIAARLPGDEEANRDAETVREALTVAAGAWSDGPTRDAFTEALAALDRLAARSGGKGGGEVEALRSLLPEILTVLWGLRSHVDQLTNPRTLARLDNLLSRLDAAHTGK